MTEKEKEKKTVLENIEGISAEDLFNKYIKPDSITLEEMKATEKLRDDKRKKIQNFIAQENALEEIAWKAAQDEGTIDSYNKYLNSYPTWNKDNCKMAEFAKRTLNQNEENKTKKKKDILERIKLNSNAFHPDEINKYIHDGEITQGDLYSNGIPTDVINALPNFRVPKLKLGSTPELIPSGFTEVYFWGIPGSGKTTLISAILSHADKEGILEIGSGNGFYYMNQLKNIFKSAISFLPSPTNVEVTQCLPFELKDNAGKKHPIALIELSGEIFECFFYKEGQEKLPSDSHEITFNTLTNFLHGANRKVHFFVFDLSKDSNELDKNGFSQDQYLDAAQKFFKTNNIFRNSTDAIYIISTKSDLLNCEEGQKSIEAGNYINRHFASFVSVLKDACKSFKINDNNSLRVVPFSLGRVYFNVICEFDNRSSAEIVKILQQKTGALQGKSKLSNFFNK